MGSPPPSAAPSTLPAIPSSSGRSLGPSQPPIVWIGGELIELRANRLQLKEVIGSVITLRLLGGDATTFFRISDGEWERVNPREGARPGARACVETLMNGQTLLALRVFLGADCGPSP